MPDHSTSRQGNRIHSGTVELQAGLFPSVDQEPDQEDHQAHQEER
jgi:hypothetical protein